jgi:hypothetical protein
MPLLNADGMIGIRLVWAVAAGAYGVRSRFGARLPAEVDFLL